MHPSQTANNHGILEHHLLLHGILVNLGNLSGSRAPVSDELDLELSGGDTEKLQQTGLAGIKNLALAAHLVWVLERDLALDEGGWDLESSQLWLEGMGHWHILLLWDLAAHGVNGAGWDGESTGSWGTGTGEIDLGVLSEVLDDSLWAAVGE